MKRFGFPDSGTIGRKYSFQLSGGMNQRVISVLGLMSRREWVIADEPTKGLDAILRRQVFQVLREIAKRDTKSMIVITHDVMLAGRLCQKLLVLYKGEILEQGDTDKIMEDPLHPLYPGTDRRTALQGNEADPPSGKEREGKEAHV